MMRASFSRDHHASKRTHVLFPQAGSALSWQDHSMGKHRLINRQLIRPKRWRDFYAPINAIIKSKIPLLMHQINYYVADIIEKGNTD